MRGLVIGTVGLALLALAGTAHVRADEGKEEKIALDKLPKAVVEAVKKKFEGCELVGAEKEKEDGKEVYEVAIKHKGQRIEVTLTPEGKVVSVEKQIDVKDFPKEVRDALDAKYPKATVKIAEEVTAGDKLTYEVLIVTADKKTIEVVFDPKGKVLKEEKKKDKEEKEK